MRIGVFTSLGETSILLWYKGRAFFAVLQKVVEDGRGAEGVETYFLVF